MFWLLLLFQDSAIMCQECELSPSISHCISSVALEVWKLLYPSRNTSYKRRTVSFQENHRYSIWLSFWMTFFKWNSLRGKDCFGFPLFGLRNKIAVPVMGFSLSSTTSANDWEGKWRGDGGKNKTHPPSIGNFKCSHCLINTNMPWQTRARPDSINFSSKRENLSTTLWVQNLRPTMRQL